MVEEIGNIYHVIVSTIYAKKYEVTAKDEDDARENYWKGKVIDEKEMNSQVDDVEIMQYFLECLECGEEMRVEGNNVVCTYEDCGITHSIEEQKKQWKDLRKKHDK